MRTVGAAQLARDNADGSCLISALTACAWALPGHRVLRLLLLLPRWGTF